MKYTDKEIREACETALFRRLITELYPSGIVSIVADTWDFWKVISEYTVELKEEILNREENALGLAKVVFRPDSGNPVDVICGTCYWDNADKSFDNLRAEAKDYGFNTFTVSEIPYNTETGKPCQVPVESPEVKGAIEVLWDIFGGTVNEEGYKELNPRVGLIYGDSITLERQQEILTRLEAKGFASTNVVFGIGSYSYQYNTRDTFGMAMKATYGEVYGEGREIFKDPITDDGVKKSARGLLRVDLVEGEYVLTDQCTWEQEQGGELKSVFKDGVLVLETSLEEIRARLW